MTWRRVGFVLPRTSTRPVGALSIIYGMADRLADRGHHVVLAHPDDRVDHATGPHPWHKAHPAVASLVDRDLDIRWPGGHVDAVVATAWQTVPWVARYTSGVGAKIYWLQDYETYHLGTSPERARLRDTFSTGWPTIVTSPALRRLVRQHASGPVVEIPCAIDTAIFTTIIPIDAPERSLIGFPARPEEAKRTVDAIHAIQRVRSARRIEGGWWCFGHWRPPGLPRWITHHPAPTTVALRDLYNHTRIFVVPSQYEGFGLPGLEAMACGAALVSTRNSGVDTYADQQCALLCPPRDPDALAAAILRLLDDATLRSPLARTGAARAARFGWQRAVDAFDRFLAAHAHPTSQGRPL